MNYLDQIHDKAKSYISEYCSKDYAEEKLLNLENIEYDGSFDKKMELLNITAIVNIIYKKEDWEELVRTVYSSVKTSKPKITQLTKRALNDAEISTYKKSAWRMYASNLEDNNWTKESIVNIQESAFSILKMLSKDTINETPVKGLVVGSVQSGKTANMAGLISMAADYGFNYFIILSGMIDNLRKQTQSRMVDDLSSDSVFSWHVIENPKKTMATQYKLQNLNLKENAKERYITVALKNSTRLKNLNKWLYSDENKLKQLKILIIDDEADQASINTAKIEEAERTKINSLILELVHGTKDKKVQAMNYISYTATPYANVLNEAGENTLYPSDFIVSLPTSPDYIGPQKIFGLEEPEEQPKLDIVREITEAENEEIIQLHNNEIDYLPQSLERAIKWFLISFVGMKDNGHKKPVSMLIHTSQNTKHHQEIAKLVKEYLESARKRKDKFINECKELFIDETVDFTKEYFLDGMPEYSNPNIKDYPSWEKIEKGLYRMMSDENKNESFISHINLNGDGEKIYHKRIHLCIDNSIVKNEDEFVRLAYPDRMNDPRHATAFIIVGGHTLSRGLTIEGLTTSYFLRTTKTADTLMQMGRWFGYRKGYELFPRIWLNDSAKTKFIEIAQLDYEMREEIENFGASGLTPSEVGPKIRNSPNNFFMQVTSKNKQQAAVGTDMDFSGISKQTILFKDNKDELAKNIETTTNFLNALPTPRQVGSKLVWNDISYNDVRTRFLDKYIANARDKMFANLPSFLNWYDQLNEDNPYKGWSIILSSKNELVQSNEQTKWDIHGFEVNNVSRTRSGDVQSDGTISLGVLRTPTDLLRDIPDLEITETSIKSERVREIREDHGFGEVPQLIIYRIDKDSKINRNIKQSKNSASKRHDLNFSEDIIGISLMVPGTKNATNLARHLQIPIQATEEFTETEYKNLEEE